MKAKTFGLDIGTSSIKAVLLDKNGNLISLDSIISAPSASKGLMSESPIDQQMLADSIKKMLASANIDTLDVNVSLPQNQVYSKIVEMPELSEQELQAALKWEMEQHIPLPLDQVKTDWQILEHREKDGKKTMNVLIVAAPLVVLNKYDKILTLAGLIPQAIETEIISVCRALLPFLNASGSDLLIHIGASTTDVAVIRNKIINLVFSIPLGGIAITRAISVDLGVDLAQAENFKKAYGLSQEVLEGKVGKSLSPVLESITEDIKKAILLFKEKNNNEEIKQIILSGGSSLLPGIDIFFTNTFGIQVVIGNSWQANNINNVPPEILKEGASYNVVTGLALRDLL